MPTSVDSVEYIPDAYDAIIQEVNKGNIVLVKYDEFIKKKGTWLKRIIQKEYEKSADHPEYRYFLKNHFDFLEK